MPQATEPMYLPVGALIGHYFTKRYLPFKTFEKKSLLYSGMSLMSIFSGNRGPGRKEGTSLE